MEIGARIRAWRQLRQLRLRELAERVPELDASKLSKIETGRRGCYAREAELIAESLGLSMGAFYGELE